MPSTQIYDPSVESIRPLMETFWSGAGWRTPREWPGSGTFSAAVARGVMFSEPRLLDHDGWVEAARTAVAKIAPGEVEDAFLASLTSRRLDLRSSLGSFVVARNLPAHSFSPDPEGYLCAICGMYGLSPKDQDLNVLNFERFKWGGVRRDHVEYIAFDLEQFARAPRLVPSQADYSLGKSLLDSLRSLPAGVTASEAVKSLKALKGNKAERDNFVGILGLCDILRTPDHGGYLDDFVRHVDRETPPRHFVDQSYPASWWRSEHGVNQRAIDAVLPRLA